MSAPRPKNSTDSTLARDLADFLVEFSIVLHKRSIYPAGHPYLQSSADRFADRLATLLEPRESVTLGVARDRLVIESATTDPANALLRDLSHRLHRHQIAAITFSRGAAAGEIEELLAALGADPERGDGPVGRRLDIAAGWRHVLLRGAGYARLTLQDGAGSRGVEQPGRDFWLALAQSELTGPGAAVPPAEPGPRAEPLIVAAADRGSADAAYHAVVLDYLSNVAEERSGRAGVGAGEERLRQRVSELLERLDPGTLQRLLETDADHLKRGHANLGASQAVAVDAVVSVLEAAAAASHHTISHNLLRLLHKLALQAKEGDERQRAEAGSALRRNVAKLIGQWDLEDPNPGAYTAILEGMVRVIPELGPYEGETRCDPEVIVRMAVEVDSAGPAAVAAAEALSTSRRLRRLAELLDAAPAGAEVLGIWPQVATDARLRAELGAAEPDHRDIAILVSHLGAAATGPLLDALEQATARSARAAILKHLLALGPVSAAAAAGRMDGAPWYMQRNLLLLVGQWSDWPEGFSPLPWARHPDVRVRREAIKLLLGSVPHRTEGILIALADADAGIVTLALGAAADSCPPEALPLVERLALDAGRESATRVHAVRVLARAQAPESVGTLVALATVRRRWFHNPLAPRSPELLAAVAALARHWSDEPRAAPILEHARRHPDAEIRHAARGQP